MRRKTSPAATARPKCAIAVGALLLLVTVLLAGCEWLAVGMPLRSIDDAAISGGPEEESGDSGDTDDTEDSPDDSAETYTVTYDANGATSGSAPADQTKTEGSDVTIAGNTGGLAKTGYNYAGWNTASDGSGTDYAEGATYTDDADLTLYAKWTTLPTYTVTYHPNGADGGSVPPDQTKTHGVDLTLASNTGGLYRADHSFAGWTDGSGTDYAEGATYTADAVVTLYAKWTTLPTYTVTYHPNGATGGSAPPDQTKTQGVDLTLANNTGGLTNTGYTLTGWNDQTDGEGTHYDLGGTYTTDADEVLYAEWKILFPPGSGTTITNSADGALSVYATDLDGDGDADVLSASSDDHRIVWYQNTDGVGTFSAGTDITTTADGAESVYATDLDGDGDADALSASYDDDRIVWYENTLDVDGTFSAGTDITSGARSAQSVYATDLDGDEDADVLSASRLDDRIVWYENRLDQAENDFSVGTAVTDSAEGAASVYATDLDGDGDADVLSASEIDDRITWYENRLDQAEADFSAGTDITGSAEIAASVYATDLDGDGDADVLSASNNRIVWYENTLDVDGTFSAGTNITSSAHLASSVYATDLDGDGDADVLSASQSDDRIVWYENTDGAGTFSAGTDITTTADGASSVYATDLDGDGDTDVLSASYLDDRIVWYENRLIE